MASWGGHCIGVDPCYLTHKVKENRPSLRNTRVIDFSESHTYQAIRLGVAYRRQFREQGIAVLRVYGRPGAILNKDVKHLLPAHLIDRRP
ncbi:MAG: hypothetical protein AB1648_02320 [Pseudomonadota bacterium]